MPTDADILADALQRLPKCRETLEANLGTIPAATGGHTSSGASDRTGRLAVSFITDPRTDPARHDLAQLDTLLATAKQRGRFTPNEIHKLADIVDRWAPTERRRHALDANLRAAADDLLDQSDWNKCQSHRRIPDHAPPETRRPGGRLCRWCEDWVRALNDPHGDWALEVDMPPLEMVRANAIGAKIDRHLPPRRRADTKR